jgi:phosphoglycerate kinase
MDDILLDGKVVLVRVDFNVAVGKDGVVDRDEDYRIEAAVPTIEELLQRRCKVLLLTHLGRPGEEEGDFDVAPAARRLSDLLHEDVRMLKHLSGDSVRAAVGGLTPGSVAMLPNVRLDEREAAGSERFAAELADTAEVYVNEAFSVSHRDHTSVALVPKLLPSCAGRRCVAEFEVLSKLSHNPPRPYVACVSGAKVSTKLNLLERLLTQVDHLCLGGVLANTFLVALRKCSVETCAAEELEAAEELWSRAQDKIELPEDVVVGSPDGTEARTVSVSEIPSDVGGVWDVGPQTVRAYSAFCREAQTIMWNGPLGMYEEPAYRSGTRLFAEELAGLPGVRVVGGGDTVTALEQLKLTPKFNHVSVGGGAMLELLEGKEMPGLAPLFF